MIAFVKGIVHQVGLDQCLLDVHGVGYRVFIAESTRIQLVEGTEQFLYTYCHVREDAWQLYGFLHEAEYELFCLLVSVSGIGPKVAMAMLSNMDVGGIKTAIVTENVPALVKLPGIGKKTAERLVLELKDKMGHWVVPEVEAKKLLPNATVATMPAGPVEDVLMALAGLGYAESEAEPVVTALAEQYTEVPDLLRASLKALGQKA